MIKVLECHYLGNYRFELLFSDGECGQFDVLTYCRNKQGSLLKPLQSEEYVRRCFIDAGALGWPNGLELSPARLYELSGLCAAA
ncbi:DUF2442 domain-containing protein [Chromatium okenii]|uniref:DUF2442 domain-containing protein n=1 Tax=Chromatium okenii TaxID=61644 RepID=UPI0026F06190|nr:DUF2442 domain-containing protein [Chromatium okenii]MBV5310374.1 DUF2442 domain-containing protein [Chromatium okenii]